MPYPTKLTQLARRTSLEAAPMETERSTKNPETGPPLGPITSALRGALAASGTQGKAPESALGREDYRAHLEEKYQ
jgi:hypothetical protein